MNVKTKARSHTEMWDESRALARIEKDLPKGSPARSAFDQLCADGCESITLVALLIKTIAEAHLQPATLFETFGTDPRELKKLPYEIDHIAQRIERNNAFLQAFLSAQSENLRGPDRYKAALYRHLPKELRIYAADLRIAFAMSAKDAGPKKYDSLRSAAATLVEFVKSRTGKPHYESLANILSYYFPRVPKRVRNGKGDELSHKMPSLFDSAPALKENYRRMKKRGLVRSIPSFRQQ
ncbi:MAG TPA: hypothetical protein VGS27_28215 [Candidatus Sulfotelmatobacter sp.]|nr:hypothetical protein [Candidatus Sulfotelmatobacter sp.]